MLQRAARALDRIAAIPEEAYLAGLCVLSGVALLTAGPQPGRPEGNLPDWLVYTWACMLTCAGILVLTGRSTGTVRIERAGLHMLAWTCCAYALMQLALLGLPVAALSGIALIGYAAVCWRRSWLLEQARRAWVRAEQIAGES
jgi:hypothetical protein